MKSEGISIDTLILSGGCIKGIAYIGVIKRLEELKIDIKTIYCVSVGCIIGVLYGLGYTYNEMKSEIYKIDLSKLIDVKMSNLINNYGFDLGDKIIGWVVELMNKKNYTNELTFKELYEKTRKDIRMVVTNLSKNELEIFSNDTVPEMKIIDGIRMAINIPLLFTLQEYNGNIYIDGAIINNYPIGFLRNKYLLNLKNTIGIKFIFDNTEIKKESLTLYNYIYHIIKCTMKNKHMLKDDEIECTINIRSNISLIDFNITKKEKVQLIKTGYKSIKEFII